MVASDHLGGHAEERTLLSGFLDWNRAVVEHKVQGLAREDAARVMTPTGLCRWVSSRTWHRRRWAGSPRRSQVSPSTRPGTTTGPSGCAA
jgi:hypothetical protein